MDTRVAVISIIVENPAAIEELNHYLHEAGEYIIGRMGIPYREKGINIISIAIDAPQDMIRALSGLHRIRPAECDSRRTDRTRHLSQRMHRYHTGNC